MSALPPKADILEPDGNVRFVPEADIPAYADLVFVHPVGRERVRGPPKAWINSHLCLATNNTAICAVMVQRTVTLTSDKVIPAPRALKRNLDEG